MFEFEINSKDKRIKNFVVTIRYFGIELPIQVIYKESFVWKNYLSYKKERPTLKLKF